MKVKSFQEKSIIWHSNRGSVGFLIIVCVVILLCLLPIQIFLVKALSDVALVHKTKDILHIASINSFQAFSKKSLGSGFLSFDKQRGREIFCDTSDELWRDNPRINFNEKSDLKFLCDGKSVVIRCSVQVRSFFGYLINVKEEYEFLPEFP